MIGGVILAAGSAARMGRPKQLLPLRGEPILQHVVDRVAGAGLDGFVVVLGHAHEAVIEALSLPAGGQVVVNTAFRSGQASSLARGLEALPEASRAAVVFLGDEPELPAATIRSVLEAYERTGGPVVRARYRGRPGHPVVLDRSVWAEVVEPGTDRGAGPVLARHPEWVVDVDLDRDPPVSLDTPEDYRLLTGRLPDDP